MKEFNAISFENVSIAYKGVSVFSGFSEIVARGEKVAISGPSGSGKSTLLNAIMGFVPVANGKIMVFETPVVAKTIKKVRKQIAWLPQELPFLFKDNLEMVMFPFGFAQNRKLKPEMDELLQLMSRLELPEYLLKKGTDEISGGQKQRLLLASVLLLKRDILLLDEPTSALDDKACGAILNYLSGNKELTVVSTSHDAGWVGRMDKIIQLKTQSI
ncbi:MAG: ABC transporter ATP-binding protein [Draconibacterium sp.]|nr:MAG: ABC transporter ATP-binding protein [Draconibacterium sp.]